MYVGIDICGIIPFILRPQEILQPDAVMGHLQRSKPEVQQVLCGRCLPVVTTSPILAAEVSTPKDWLSADENSLRTGTEAVTVAMFSKEFQEWSESCVSRAAWLDSVGMADGPLPQLGPPTFIASQSMIPHYTNESSIVDLRTPPDRLPDKGIMNIPQNCSFRVFSRAPSSHVNSPPPVPVMKQLHRDQPFLSDHDGSADLWLFSPTPDKYNIPPRSTTGPSLFAVDSTMSFPGEAVSDADQPSTLRHELSAIETFLDELAVSPLVQHFERDTYNNNARPNTINTFLIVVRVAANVKSPSSTLTHIMVIPRPQSPNSFRHSYLSSHVPFIPPRLTE
jgi:hypothetical protein